MQLLSIDGHDNQPLVEQIVQGVQRQVEQRALRPGTRLPSIRQFAEEHRVSRFTVVQAYDRLVAAGYLRSRRGSGFYVARPVEQPSSNDTLCQLDRAVDVLWLLHRSLSHPRPRLLPGCGWLPPDWQDENGLQRGLRNLARLPGSHLFEYGSAQGYRPFRQDAQHRLGELGVNAHPDQIITTHGVSHSLDLVGRFFIKPGDAVLVDDPGYFNIFGYLQSLGARVIGIPRDVDGPDTTVLAEKLRDEKPKLFFTNTVLHNPTGTSLSQARAHRLLAMAEAHDLMIVEDDIYGDLHPQPVTRLATLDQLQRVIYVNSFSKTISASARVGYLACRPDLARKLVDLKLLTGLTTSEIGERLIHQVLREGYYRKHLDRLRGRLNRARDHTVRNLERSGLEVFGEPEHGMFVWARWSQCGRDTAELANKALERGIMLAPGNIFRPHQKPSAWIRFNVAFCGDPSLFDFLRRAGDLVTRSPTELADSRN
jgi:DNA-binding transcriptional MocR family regulator